jgi:hypothetical protein
MMMDAIDIYLAQLERQLTVNEDAREAILEEVRGHLEDASVHYIAGGMTDEDAEREAIAAFGLPEQVAGRFNAIHPLHWDRRRMFAGMLWGIVCSWGVWTLVTFPWLMQVELQPHQLVAGFEAPAPSEILFQAMPFAFGLFKVMSYGSAVDRIGIVVTILLLFCIVPFLWGRQARQNWRPGLAYGLGVIVGFPWLLPGIIRYWRPGENLVVTLFLFVVIFAIWSLLPFAMLASWLGHRFAPLHRSGTMALAPTSFAKRLRLRIQPVQMAVAVLVCLLVGINVWSWFRTPTLSSIVSVNQQLSAAQQVNAFPIRQPTVLPDGVTLVQVDASAIADAQVLHGARCTVCDVYLTYLDVHGNFLRLQEWNGVSPIQSEQHLSPPPNYLIRVESGYGEQPWWLGVQLFRHNDIRLAWRNHSINFEIYSNGGFSVNTLKQIAGSI